jgi:tryptophan halogenase
MLPTRAFEPADARRYNRLMAAEFDSVRDFLILHFHATERRDTPYWDQLAAMSVPDTLLERLRIYRATGRVFRESDELFTKTSWLAVLDGQGPEVEGHEPLADGLPLDQVRARLRGSPTRRRRPSSGCRPRPNSSGPIAKPRRWPRSDPNFDQQLGRSAP